MTPRMSAPAAAPVGALTLNPLSTHGLWLAVMTMPAAAPRSTTSYELIWVGTAWTAKRDRDVVGEEDLGRGRGEVLGGEPPVVGDDDALGRLAPLDDVAGDAVGAAADVLERELVGDPGPPAVGPEDDGRGRRRAGRVTSRHPPGSAQRSISASIRARSGAAPRSTAIGCVAVMLPRSSGAMTPRRPPIAPDRRGRRPRPRRSRRPGRPPRSRARRSPPSSAVHDPRSDQPTSIEAMTTWPSRAALSMTA